eukprot:gnl/Spiro4/5952_TR3047_c0_g1_i1.p1 gnl/Spiro4/5952_TR3047_c0_g1~~gnl/Spiro4/5952_TR3047_c0_g1_i1.p1  ORF type:complete len:194 (+),score=43.69 gnl/Spiro4/5952_TR3047_c0_g1_i1:81-662(+)
MLLLRVSGFFLFLGVIFAATPSPFAKSVCCCYQSWELREKFEKFIKSPCLTTVRPAQGAVTEKSGGNYHVCQDLGRPTAGGLEVDVKTAEFDDHRQLQAKCETAFVLAQDVLSGMRKPKSQRLENLPLPPPSAGPLPSGAEIATPQSEPFETSVERALTPAEQEEQAAQQRQQNTEPDDDVTTYIVPLTPQPV